MFVVYSIKTAKTKIQETKIQSTSTITDGGQVKLKCWKVHPYPRRTILEGETLTV